MKVRQIFRAALWAVLLLGGKYLMAQENTSIGIIVVKDIDSEDADLTYQSAVVSDDVYSDGKLIIAAGTPVMMDIHYADNHGLGVPGEVSARPISTTDIYNRVLKLDGATMNRIGKSRRGAAIGCGVFFGIVTFPVGLLFLCIKGADAEIPEGTRMLATVKLN